jgi:DNA-binding response OmpR family regulator
METIIVQDKDAAILDMLSSALEMEGFEVVSLNTCDEKIILEQIDKTRPHVIMLDVRLSDQDCINVTKIIKQKYAHLPVLALSCNDNVDKDYDKHGFDGYIKKPFDLDLLYRILRKHLGKKNT